MEEPPQHPPDSELQKAYETLLKRRAYCANYMKKFRQEHKEEWNAQARKRYAKKRQNNRMTIIARLLKTNKRI